MKKIVYSLFTLILFIPLIKVNAIDCSDVLPLTSKDINFTCSDIDGEELKFTYNGEDYSKYFEYDVKNKRIKILDAKGLVNSLESTVEIANIQIKDASSVSNVKVKNSNYVPTTTTTTTTAANQPTYTVTLDHNNNSGEKTEKTCTVSSNNNSCSITLPTLEDENFNGWGTAKTCKNGSSGIIRVTENATYYACYKNQTQETEKNNPFLKTLNLIDEATNESIDFGTFSIKKMKYEVSVENTVTSIKVDATFDEGVTLDVSGNTELKEGENEITIKLVDSNNNETVYSVIVTRLKEGETLDPNRYLTNLTVGYPINFQKDVFEYYITIDPDVNQLVLDYDTEIESDTVSIVGNENLENGSIITLKVSNEEGKFSEYLIHINKITKDNTLIYIILGSILFTIIVLLVIVFIKSNKKGTGTKNSKKEKKNKKNKKNKNQPEVLPDSNDDIEVLKF